MWAVSEAYKEAIIKPSREFKIEVTVDYTNGERAVFTDATIKDDVVIRSKMLSSEEGDNTIDIGAVPEKILELTLIDTDSDLHRYAGAQLNVKTSLKLYSGVFEPVPMGTFYADASEMSRVGTLINVVAYDGMVTFGYTISDSLRKQLNGTTPTVAARLLASKTPCGYNQDLSELPNGNRTCNFTSSQIVTGWDGIMWIAQMLGCFARINRENNLEFVPIRYEWLYYNEEHSSGRIVENRKITETERYDGIKFSDDRVHIVNLVMPGDGKYIESKHSAELEADSNVTILLEKNPLLMSMDGTYNETVIKSVMDNMLINLSTVYIYAFQVDISNDPALDAGDVIRMSGGKINGTNKNNDLYGFIAYNTWRYRGMHTITSTGQTPILYENEEEADNTSHLQTAKQSDKLINSLVNETNSVSTATKQIENQVQEIYQIIEGGGGGSSDRAKYIQTYDDTTNAASKIKTLDLKKSGVYTMVGYVAGNISDTGATMPPGKLQSRYEYSDRGVDAYNEHSIYNIDYELEIAPHNSSNPYNLPDRILLQITGSASKSTSTISYTGSSMLLRLTGAGYWVTNDRNAGSPERDLIYIYYQNQKTKTSRTENITLKQIFVIAGIQFEVDDNGVTITRLSEYPAYPESKSIVIPWGSTLATVVAQSEAAKVSPTVAQSVTEKDEDKEVRTYDDDGIHISWKGHKKFIPWDE